MPKVSNTIIYPQDDNLSMDDYTIGTNSNTGNKKTQTYAFKSIFSLFYNFLGYNAFFNTTDTTTYPIGTPGCFYVFDENDDLTSDFSEARKITFSSYDTYNFDTANYFNIIVSSGKFLFKLINLEDKNNFVFLNPSNFVLSGTGTTFNVDVLAEAGLSNGSFVNYKRYLLVLEFAAGTFNPADYDLSDFTNTSGNPFVTAQDLTDALSLLPTPITNHSELTLNDGTNPHGTTKTDVGLGNVQNIDTTTTENISDTSTKRFVTDFEKSTWNGKQDKIIVVSANITAEIDKKYHVVANATFTDPASPVEGKGYEVFVRNGTATIGGVAYPVNSYVFRTYHSGVWASQLIGGNSTTEDNMHKEWMSVQARYDLGGVFTTNMAVLVSSGTQSLVARAGTNLYNSLSLQNYVTSTATGQNAGLKENNVSHGTIRQGFDAFFMFANNSTDNQHMTTVGFYSLTSAIPNLAISSFTGDFFGVGNDVGDANLSFYAHRVAIAGQTASYVKVATNSSFPAHTTTDAYLLRIEAPQTEVEADRYIKMTLTNIVTGATIEHTFSYTETPILSRNLLPVINRNNRNSGTATNIRFGKYNLVKKSY